METYRSIVYREIIEINGSQHILMECDYTHSINEAIECVRHRLFLSDRTIQFTKLHLELQRLIGWRLNDETLDTSNKG